MTITSSDSPAVPRPEHPRPDFMREPWINLNGRWRFTFDKTNEGEQRRWHRLSHPDSATGIANGYPNELSSDPFAREIVVPYPWESPLSEIEEPDYKGAAWYQRVVTVPEDWAGGASPPRQPAPGSASRFFVSGPWTGTPGFG